MLNVEVKHLNFTMSFGRKFKETKLENSLSTTITSNCQFTRLACELIVTGLFQKTLLTPLTPYMPSPPLMF